MKRLGRINLIVASLVVILSVGVGSRHWFARGDDASLQVGRTYVYDLGIQVVNGDDHDARLDFYFTNGGSVPIQIGEIRKACTCTTLLIDPSEQVPPGADVHVRYGHTRATNGRGGYFRDAALVNVEQGGVKGQVAFEFSGFVLKTSHVIPSNVIFEEMADGAETKSRVVLAFLSRLTADGGTLRINPTATITHIDVPEGITAKVIEGAEFGANASMLPKGLHPATLFPPFSSKKEGVEATATEEKLTKLVSSLNVKEDDLWQVFPILISVDPAHLTKAVDGVVRLHISSGHILIPVKASVPSPVIAYPSSVAFVDRGAPQRAEIKLSSYSGRPLKIKDIRCDLKGLHWSSVGTGEISNPVIVRLLYERDKNDRLSAAVQHDRIRIDSDQGRVDLPVSVMSSAYSSP